MASVRSPAKLRPIVHRSLMEMCAANGRGSPADQVELLRAHLTPPLTRRIADMWRIHKRRKLPFSATIGLGEDRGSKHLVVSAGKGHLWNYAEVVKGPGEVRTKSVFQRGKGPAKSLANEGAVKVREIDADEVFLSSARRALAGFPRPIKPKQSSRARLKRSSRARLKKQ